MSKLNVVRQIKQGKTELNFQGPLENKEMGWNNRHHLGKLPEYNAFNDNNYLSMQMLREQIKQMERGQQNQYNKKQNRFGESRMKASAGDFNNYEGDSYNEELNVILTMWDDLGVTEEYKTIFESIARELEAKFRKELFELEISALMRLSDNLTKLSKEVQGREKSIEYLKKFEQALLRGDAAEKMINDLIQCIRNIRIQSINIVNHFIKIREICSYSVIGGKFDLERINKLYMFDRNYLIKMKFDLEFLKGSSIGNFFTISDDADPFIVSAGEETPGKYSVGLNEDMLISIKQCQFLIMQDLIFYQIQTVNIEKKKNKSPNKFKINYPLARETRSRISSPNNIALNNLNVNKSSSKYNNLFLTKEPAFDKSKRIQIDTKEREPEKSTENLRNFQNIKTERVKSKQREEIQKGNNRDGVGNASHNLNNSKMNKLLEENINTRSYMEQNNKDNKYAGNNLYQKKEVKIEKLNYESKNLMNSNKLETKAETKINKTYKDNLEQVQMEINAFDEKEDNYNFNEYNEGIEDLEHIEINNNVNKEDVRVINNSKGFETKTNQMHNNKNLTYEIEAEENIEELNNNFNKNDSDDGLKEKLKFEKTEKEISQHQSAVKDFIQDLFKFNPASVVPVKTPHFIIEYFNNSLANFTALYKDYFKQIPQDQKSSFKPSESIKSFYKGINPKILLAYTESKALIGMCCLSYDFSSDNSLRLYIHHISAAQTENLENILVKFVEFIFANFVCDEIMIEIHYEFLNGVFNMNKTIFNILKDKLKFKWSNLENRTAQDRLQKMNLKRVDSSRQDTDTKLYKHSLRLKYATVLKVQEQNSTLVINENKHERDINVFPLIYSLIELTNDKYTLENENFKNFNSIQLKNLSKNIIDTSIGDRQKVVSFLEANQINSAQLYSQFDSDLHSCLLNVNVKFSSILSTKVKVNGNGYLYNRIEQSSYESLIDETTSQVFHVIPTGDGYNSLIVAQLNDQFLQVLKEEGKNMCQIFYDLYSKLENRKVEEAESTVIWIPSFAIDSHNSFQSPKLMSDVVIRKDTQDYRMSLLDEFKQLSFMSDKHYTNSIQISPGKDDIFIDNTFLISLVNVDILTELNIPSLFLQLVPQDKWVKIE